MNWNELKESIENMTEYQRNTDVTLYLLDEDEYFMMDSFGFTGDYDDILDKNSPYLACSLTC